MKKEIETAAAAQKIWKNTSFDDRQKLLRNLAQVLKSRQEEAARNITDEMHKPIQQSLAEVEKCVGMIEYYAALKNVLSPEKITTEKQTAEIYPAPLGVILGIMPWNYPFWQVLRFAVPTILAGNTVLLKHASICEKSGDLIASLFPEAGFDEGIFQHLKVSHEQVEEIIRHPAVQGVSLTGSESVGRHIGKIAGENLKKCVLELGGNDAFIVLEDADLNKAAKDAALARLQNTGQTCVAGKRFIVVEAVYEEFIQKFIAEYQKFHAEDVYDAETQLGQMARPDLADDLEQQYKVAIDEGAKPIVALERKDAITFSPGLLSMNPDNKVADEELFGPLGMVFKVKDSAEALQLANSTKFGLANAVYTQNPEMASHFARELESGSVAVNQVFRSDVHFPFGGVKASGFGTELSEYALWEFTHRKTIIGSILF